MSNSCSLTEEIDVPTVDMVAFLTPKRSKVDIVQAVGRAMRNAPGKTTGYILVPLYVEQAAGESLDAAVARAEFDEVWAVLQAMQEQDEVLDDLIHQMQAERRLNGSKSSEVSEDFGRLRPKEFNDSRLRVRVEVLGPTLMLDKLRRAIATRCLDRLARPWDEMVQWLVAYQKQHRHPRVRNDAPAFWTALLSANGPVALLLNPRRTWLSSFRDNLARACLSPVHGSRNSLTTLLLWLRSLLGGTELPRLGTQHRRGGCLAPHCYAMLSD